MGKSIAPMLGLFAPGAVMVQPLPAVHRLRRVSSRVFLGRLLSSRAGLRFPGRNDFLPLQGYRTRISLSANAS